MNFKTHKKGLIALALVFFMIMPMFAAVNLVKATDSAAASFAVYQSGTGGTTDVSSVTVPASPNPIGATVSFDVYLYNAANVWGWTIPTVSWNPAVLQLTKVTEGPWLENNVAEVSTDFVGASSSLYNNVLGVLSGGMSEACTSDTVAATSAGVVATLKFTISGYGTSPITIAGATVADNSEEPPSGFNAATAISSASITVEAPALSISLVPSGQTSGSTIVWPSNEDPIGGTFSVDAYIQGIVSSDNLWGWNLGVSWNPSVLECTSVTQGSYLDSGTPSNTFFTLGSIDNTDGSIHGGVSCALNTYTTQTAAAGVLMTLAFEIISYGSCSITLSPGTPATLLNNAYPHVAITGATLNSLAYSWTPLPATPPTASAAITNSPFGTGSDNTFTGFGITLSGAASTPGTNTEPPGQSCPITSYSWSITLVGATTPITMTGETIQLTGTQIGETIGTITAILTVTAPSPTNTPAPSYVDTTSTTLTIQVIAPNPGGVLDIWTQTGGQGYDQSASSIGPQQLVDLYAYVSYNGAPVADKTVTFEVIAPNGGGTFYTTAETDVSGLAMEAYRVPWQDSNPTGYFGVVTIYGTVDVAQVILNDTVSFYYGYQLQVDAVKITNGDITSGTPTFNRYGMAGTDGTPKDGNIVQATVNVTNTMWNSQTFWLSAVIYDNNSVPVAQFLALENIGPATPMSLETPGHWANVTQNYYITLTIPTWAYVGGATLYVNIFNSTSANSLQNAIAWSPQVSAKLAITAGVPPGVMENPSGGVKVAPTQVLNIVYNVTNDEDTGIYGYWALDNYEVDLQVWSLGSNQYQFIATYIGTFTTFNGDLSPQTGTTEIISSPNGATGTLKGQIIGTFTATTFDPNGLPQSKTALPQYGTIATPFNFGGTHSDLLLGTYSKQKGDTTYTDVMGLYFPGYTNLNNQEWGFTYMYGNTVIQSGPNAGQPDMNHIWNNNSALNTGDIIVQDA